MNSCRSIFIACPTDGPLDEVMVHAHHAVMVGAGVVRVQYSGVESFAFQYSAGLVMDMRSGGSDPMNVGAGSPGLYHMNNICCADPATADSPGAFFRVMPVGSRTPNGVHVKQNTVRANLNLTRAMFHDSENSLLAMEYPCPPCYPGMSRMPMEFPYGTHVNSRVPWAGIPQTPCGCLSMRVHR